MGMLAVRFDGSVHCPQLQAIMCVGVHDCGLGVCSCLTYISEDMKMQSTVTSRPHAYQGPKIRPFWNAGRGLQILGLCEESIGEYELIQTVESYFKLETGGWFLYGWSDRLANLRVFVKLELSEKLIYWFLVVYDKWNIFFSEKNNHDLATTFTWLF